MLVGLLAGKLRLLHNLLDCLFCAVVVTPEAHRTVMDSTHPHKRLSHSPANRTTIHGAATQCCRRCHPQTPLGISLVPAAPTTCHDSPTHRGDLQSFLQKAQVWPVHTQREIERSRKTA
jgi:hypothetical protein